MRAGRAVVLAGLAAAAGAGAPAPEAIAAAPPVVVEAAAGSVVVERDPFRLTFRTAGGRTALRGLRARQGGPVRLPPTLDPELFALEEEPDRAVYAPLAFEVGRREREQWTGSYWGGNLLRETRSGTTYAARRVRSVRRVGRGVRLDVATNDPGGRRLLVSIAPDTGGTLRVRVRPSRARGVTAMAGSFASPPGEAFRGFGGRHWGTDQRGRKLYGWIEQENFGGPTATRSIGLLPALAELGTGRTLEQLGAPHVTPERFPGGPEHYLFPGGPNAAYYVQEQFVSSRPYGFLLNQPELARWRMAYDRRDAWQVHVSAAHLDFTVAPGGPRAAMRRLTAITGRHLLPPAWAQGPTVWRAVQPEGGETPATYRAKVEQDLADIERLDAPLTAYAFEGWSLLRDDAYVREVIQRLRARGIRAILYLRAYVADDVLSTQQPGDLEEVTRGGLVARDLRGAPATWRANGGAPAVLLDPTNPRTADWLRARIALMLDLGADGFMQDFGEQVQDGMRFADGSTGETMHNRYPVLFHRLSRRLADEEGRRRGRGRPWFFTRAGFSGRPGSAAFEMGTFPGDETADWGPASGLRSLAPDMLNRAVGGAFGYTTDIGGYADLITGPPDAELFTRWAQWSALTPYFRVHNSSINGTRMPWSYDPATYERWRRLAALHQRALPYLRRAWAEGRRTGVPPTRPMWLEAGASRRVAREDQQWLLGADVLVAPVVHRGATSRRVVFPRGCWTRPDGSGRIRGPAVRREDAPLDVLPWFKRCGTSPF